MQTQHKVRAAVLHPAPHGAEFHYIGRTRFALPADGPLFPDQIKTSVRGCGTPFLMRIFPASSRKSSDASWVVGSSAPQTNPRTEIAHRGLIAPRPTLIASERVCRCRLETNAPPFSQLPRDVRRARLLIRERFIVLPMVKIWPRARVAAQVSALRCQRRIAG